MKSDVPRTYSDSCKSPSRPAQSLAQLTPIPAIVTPQWLSLSHTASRWRPRHAPGLISLSPTIRRLPMTSAATIMSFISHHEVCTLSDYYCRSVCDQLTVKRHSLRPRLGWMCSLELGSLPCVISQRVFQPWHLPFNW